MINIVIPNYNGYKLLKNCLDSLKNQTYSNFSIIVVDNASDDSSYNWLNNYENVTLKKLDKNYGFSKAVNEGIKLSNSKYVVLLNNDTVVPENWLETLLGEIEKDESIFSVCSKMIRYNEKDKIDDAGDEYSILGWAYKIGDGKNISSFRKSKYVFSSCAGAAIYRNSIFDEIGYFDEDFFAYMEDIDISYRAKIYGYKNRYCSEAKIFHIGSATSGSKYNSFKVRLAARNNVYVLYKNMPFLQLIINMPFLIIGFLVKYLFFLKKGFGNDYKEGFFEGIKNLKNLNKTEFRIKNLFNYLIIEALLILNMCKYIFSKVLDIYN